MFISMPGKTDLSKQDRGLCACNQLRDCVLGEERCRQMVGLPDLTRPSRFWSTDVFGDLPDLSFSRPKKEHLQGTFPKGSATQSRVRTFPEKQWETPRLETPRITFSQKRLRLGMAESGIRRLKDQLNSDRAASGGFRAGGCEGRGTGVGCKLGCHASHICYSFSHWRGALCIAYLITSSMIMASEGHYILRAQTKQDIHSDVI